MQFYARFFFEPISTRKNFQKSKIGQKYGKLKNTVIFNLKYGKLKNKVIFNLKYGKLKKYGNFQPQIR